MPLNGSNFVKEVLITLTNCRTVDWHELAPVMADQDGDGFGIFIPPTNPLNKAPFVAAEKRSLRPALNARCHDLNKVSLLACFIVISDCIQKRHIAVLVFQRICVHGHGLLEFLVAAVCLQCRSQCFLKLNEQLICANTADLSQHVNVLVDPRGVNYPKVFALEDQWKRIQKIENEIALSLDWAGEWLIAFVALKAFIKKPPGTVFCISAKQVEFVVSQDGISIANLNHPLNQLDDSRTVRTPITQIADENQLSVIRVVAG